MTDTTDLAIPGGDDFTGLDDLAATDMVMPRLSIDHRNAVFTDNLTGQDYGEIECILLGLVKQRILWDAEVEDGDQPLCKSYDFQHGHPDIDRFPWSESGFDEGSVDDEDRLPCAGCALKEWGSAPNGKTPWCSEQHTFPLLHLIPDPSDDETYTEQPSLLTLQRSGIKPSKAYLTSFARSKTPLYTVVTRITLSQQKRGSVEYCVPKLTRVDATEPDSWELYKRSYLEIREFLHTPPVRDDDDSDGSVDEVVEEAEEAEPEPPKPAPGRRTSSGRKSTGSRRAPARSGKGRSKPAAAPAATEAVEVDEEGDDDLPF